MRWLLLAALLTGCAISDGSDEQREQARPYVTIVTDPTSAELTPGQTVKIQVFNLQDDGERQPVQGNFSSNNEAVATVDQNTGLVTAVAKGTTAIRSAWGPGTTYVSITVK